MLVMVAEDSENDVRSLCTYLDTYAKDHNLSFEVQVFSNGKELLEAHPEKAAFILLDIEMPLINGVEAARELRNRGCTMPLAFLTNLDSFALEGYTVGALGYLIKPISFFSFTQMLDRIMTFTERHTPHLVCIKEGNSSTL
ncbi:MAG: response regulator [Coriobacteriales bacterium]|nr:response regulator [Coriobacteriales bacterium]